MTIRQKAAIAAAVPLAITLLLFLVLLFVPDREIRGVVDRGLAREGYTLRAASFGKSFPLGLVARDLHLDSDKGEVLRADAAAAHLRILPLFAGRVVVAVTLRIGGGEVRGEFSPARDGKVALSITSLRLEDIPFFPNVAGARLQGLLAAKGAVHGQGSAVTGGLKLEVRGAQVSGMKLGELPLPEASYRTVQGAIRAAEGKIIIDSFTCDGDDLYARLKGDLPLMSPLASAPLNLTLELMPKVEFLERQKFVFLLLVKYQTSPGHYEIPVRGTLGRPLAF